MIVKLKSFPKISTIGENSIKHLFDNEIEITEKIDGSQFVFYKDLKGYIHMRSKGREIFLENIDKMFKPVALYIHDIKGKIPPLHIFYGETLAVPKHNVLKYDRTPKNHFAVFGVEKIQTFGSIFLDHDSITKLADELEFDIAPLLFKGMMPDYFNKLPDYLNRKSYLGNVDIEGVVVKNLQQGWSIGGVIFPITCGKFVSAAFKEVHTKSCANDYISNKDQLSLLKQKYKSFARWEKGVQHLRDNGELTNSPKDIGGLIVGITKDIEEECKESIKDDLYKIFGKEIIRYASSGIPEWYKQKLFENTQEEKK